MLTQALAVANFLLATTDAYHTAQTINKFGIGVETNRLIRKLATLMGPVNGALLAICGLAAVESALFGGLNWPIPLAILVGMRLKLLHHQILSAELRKNAQQTFNKFRRDLIFKESGGALKSASLPDLKSDETSAPPSPSPKGTIDPEIFNPPA